MNPSKNYLQSQQSCQYSNILKIILNKLSHYPFPQLLQQQTFTQQLCVIFLTKTPTTHSFICNLTHSIQIQLKTQRSKQIQQYQLTSFNKISNHYYSYPNPQTHPYDLWKVQFTLNSNDNQLAQLYSSPLPYQQNPYYSSIQFTSLSQSPSVYEPYFYFNSNFKQFLSLRNQLKFQQTFVQNIKILEWKLKIVNVSKSAAFGIIMEVIRFKYMNKKIYTHLDNSDNDKNQIKFKNIGSIMYEKEIRKALQKYRVNMIKAQYNKDQPDLSPSPISICYHLRNLPSCHKLPKLSQFVYLDKHQQILKYNNSLAINFVTFGELQGMCTFPQALNIKQEGKLEYIRNINVFNMKCLEDVLNKDEKKKRGKKGKRITGKMNNNNKDNNRLQRQNNSLYDNSNTKSYYNTYKLKQHLKSSKNTHMLSDQSSDSLWSDSNQSSQNQIQSQQQQQHLLQQNIINTHTYQEIFKEQLKYSNNQSKERNRMDENYRDNDSQDQESSEEQENQYFKKYREEMRKQGGFK